MVVVIYNSSWSYGKATVLYGPNLFYLAHYCLYRIIYMRFSFEVILPFITRLFSGQDHSTIRINYVCFEKKSTCDRDVLINYIFKIKNDTSPMCKDKIYQ